MMTPYDSQVRVRPYIIQLYKALLVLITYGFPAISLVQTGSYTQAVVYLMVHLKFYYQSWTVDEENKCKQVSVLKQVT